MLDLAALYLGKSRR